MASKIEIWSQASVKIGNGAQQSESADNEFINQVSEVYDTLFETMLSTGRFGFARKKATLARVTETPINQWEYAFQLPVDKISIYNVYPTVNYQIFGDKLFTNAHEIDVDYIYRVSEGDLPEYFVEALTLRIAAMLAYPITNNAALVGELAEQSRLAWTYALSADAQQRPTEDIVDRPLVNIRHY